MCHFISQCRTRLTQPINHLSDARSPQWMKTSDQHHPQSWRSTDPHLAGKLLHFCLLFAPRLVSAQVTATNEAVNLTNSPWSTVLTHTHTHRHTHTAGLSLITGITKAIPHIKYTHIIRQREREGHSLSQPLESIGPSLPHPPQHYYSLEPSDPIREEKCCMLKFGLSFLSSLW